MEVLKQEDRETLLKFLADNASDQALVTAALDVKAERENLRNQFQSVANYLGRKPAAKPVETSSPVPTIATQPVASEVPSPPGEACSKIGSNTRATLLARCAKPTKPEDIGRAFFPHLKLLWQRKELVWNGSEYYVK